MTSRDDRRLSGSFGLAPSSADERDDSARPVEPRLVALFAVGCVLFGYPLLGIFSTPRLVLGIPALYVYVFVSWGAFLVVLGGLVGRRGRSRRRAKRGGSESPP